METCVVETGLLRKKPCGQTSVTHCANCEAPLCVQHAVAQLSATGQKSGKFMCPECDKAQRAHKKSLAELAKDKPSNLSRQAPKPAAPPAAPAKGAPAKAAPEKAAPAEKKSDDGGIDFTPSKK
jgi:hypothetical protein